jgi:hypothetical protein
VVRVNDLITFGATTSAVLGHDRIAEAADVRRRTVPPVRKAEGTGLSNVGLGSGFGADGGVMRADQVQGTAVVRIPVADQGIPPRWRPVRC